MTYIKTVDADGAMVTLEKLDPPIWVWVQASNGSVLRCGKGTAQGVVSQDGTVLYYLEGQSVPGAVRKAVALTAAEYEELAAGYEFPEEPEEPDPTPVTTEEPMLSRAEMQARILSLEDELAATKILLGVSE